MFVNSLFDVVRVVASGSEKTGLFNDLVDFVPRPYPVREFDANSIAGFAFGDIHIV